MEKLKINSIYFIASLCFIHSVNAYAQDINLFDRGTSGFCISGSYVTSEDGDGFGFSTGLSIESIIDLGVSFYKISIDIDDYTEDVNAKGISPYIGINLIKQSKWFPLNFSVFGLNKITKCPTQILRYFAPVFKNIT